MTTDNEWHYTAHVIERGADLTNNRQRGNRGKAAPDVRPVFTEQSAEDETGETRSAGETGADESNTTGGETDANTGDIRRDQSEC